MEKLKKLIFYALLFVISLSLCPYRSDAFSGNITVLIATASKGTVKGNSLKFKDASGKTVSSSGSVSVSASGGKLQVAGKKLSMPVRVTSSSPIAWNANRYRGDIIFKRSSKGFCVGNDIDIEQYICGVLESEISPGWHIEALKAQAVIARTYALKSRGAKGGPFEICSSTSSQLYKGIGKGHSTFAKAVAETKGLILRWNGAPASTFYHSDSGGMVTSAAAVWGGNVPYLKARAEIVNYKSPKSEWQTTLTMSYIGQRLSKKGLGVGELKSIRPIARDESGRVMSLEVKGSGGTKKISGSKFRFAVGSDKIKSTLFEMNIRSPYITVSKAKPKPKPAPPLKSEPKPVLPPSASQSAKTKYPPMKVDVSEMPADSEEALVWMTENKVFTTFELMHILSRPDEFEKNIEKGMGRISGELPPPELDKPQKQQPVPSKPSYAASENFTVTPKLSMNAATGNSVTFYGRGYGHGVGLSQWGAKAMAESGSNYKEILNHYFPGTKLGP